MSDSRLFLTCAGGCFSVFNSLTGIFLPRDPGKDAVLSTMVLESSKNWSSSSVNYTKQVINQYYRLLHWHKLVSRDRGTICEVIMFQGKRCKQVKLSKLEFQDQRKIWHSCQPCYLLFKLFISLKSLQGQKKGRTGENRKKKKKKLHSSWH